jgi:hypothetical protein
MKRILTSVSLVSLALVMAAIGYSQIPRNNCCQKHAACCEHSPKAACCDKAKTGQNQ